MLLNKIKKAAPSKSPPEGGDFLWIAKQFRLTLYSPIERFLKKCS
jgi:hypothetical protein